MTPPNPDRLAGFADGELDPASRREVEEWLATDPKLTSWLRDQERLGPTSREFWDQVEPPQPDVVAWAKVRSEIVKRIRPAEKQATRRAIAIAASVILLAGLGFGAWLASSHVEKLKLSPAPGVEIVANPRRLPESLTIAPREVPTDPLAEFAILPMASSRDVLIETVAGRTLEALPTADHPLPGDLNLAAPGDVRIEAMGRRPDGTFPPLPWMSGSASETPLIYAASR